MFLAATSFLRIWPHLYGTIWNLNFNGFFFCMVKGLKRFFFPAGRDFLWGYLFWELEKAPYLCFPRPLLRYVMLLSEDRFWDDNRAVNAWDDKNARPSKRGEGDEIHEEERNVWFGLNPCRSS